MALKTTSEIALVGPLIRWADEPNSEPIRHDDGGI